jgi:hypothetical protein
MRWLYAFISYFSTHREGKEEIKKEKLVLTGTVGVGLWGDETDCCNDDSKNIEHICVY